MGKPLTEEELRVLRAAAGSNDVAMQRVTVRLAEGVTEHELARELDALYGKMRSDGYYARIAFGENTLDPHHVSDGTPLRSGDAVTVRLGCLLGDCFAVMARTFFFQHIDAAGLDAFEAVRRAGEAAFASSEPGALARDVVARMRKEVDQKGMGAGYRADDPIPQEPGIVIPFAIEELAETDAAGTAVGDGGEAIGIGSYFTVAPAVYVPGALGACMADSVYVADYGLDVISRFPRELLVL